MGKKYQGRLALERRLRETWSTGLTRYSQLTILRGRIRFIPAKDQSGHIRTELWGTGVYLHLRWFADEIPPHLRDGEMATVIGNIMTYNCNDHIEVANCLHVPKYGAQLGKEIRELVAKYVMKPKAYVSDERMREIGDRIRGPKGVRPT